MQLNDHMAIREWNLRRYNRQQAVNEIWDKINITEEHSKLGLKVFQTEGHCKNELSNELFEFKVFDGSQSICTNIQNFASNARQFLENFVCLDWGWTSIWKKPIWV